MASPRVYRNRSNGKRPSRKAKWWLIGVSTSLILDLAGFGFFHSKLKTLLHGGPASESAPDPLPESASAPSPDAPRNPLSEEAAILQAEIAANRAQAETLLTRIKPNEDGFKRLERRRDLLNAELTALKNRQDNGFEIRIEDFNAKARAFNELNGSVESAYAAYVEGYREYEILIKRDSALVAKFNTDFAGGK